MLEPLGQSQVIPYLGMLSKKYKIFLISFEKKLNVDQKKNLEQVQLLLDQHKISWNPLSYHGAPKLLSTAYDILSGLITAVKLSKRHDIKIIHTRSYVACIAAYLLKKILKIKYIFDIRGFWVDEKVEANSLREDSRLFRILKNIEKVLFKDADAIVTLTNASIPAIENILPSIQKQKIIVIPTCVDLDKFTLPTIRDFSDKDKLVIGYVGSVGGMYDFKKVIQAVCYIQSLGKNVEFVVITMSNHLDVNEEIKKSKSKILNYKVFSSNYEDIPKYLNQMHFGIYFYNRKNSRTACAPTRLAEFLACGVPVIVNPGIGDQDDILSNSGNPVGASISTFKDIDKALDLVRLNNIQQRCRSVAVAKFSLSQGVSKYSELYHSLL